MEFRWVKDFRVEGLDMPFLPSPNVPTTPDISKLPGSNLLPTPTKRVQVDVWSMLRPKSS